MTRQIAFDDRSRQQAHFSTCYMCACRWVFFADARYTVRLCHGDART